MDQASQVGAALGKLKRNWPWVFGALLVGVVVVPNVNNLTALLGAQSSVLVQAILTGVLTGSIYGLVAMGLTLIYGVMHIINFAHGTMLALAMYIFVTIVGNTTLPLLWAGALAVGAMLVVGALIQLILINPVMKESVEQKLLLTLGLSVAIENSLLAFFGPTPLSLKSAYTSNFWRLGALDVDWPLRFGGAIATLPRSIAFVGTLLVSGCLYFILQKTRLGTSIRAVADNPMGATFVGINIKTIYVVTFSLGTAATAAAGLLLLPMVNVEPTTGNIYTVIAFVVVVLGGMGSVSGALVAGFCIGILQQITQVLFPSQSNMLGVFVVFIATMFVRPQGLISKGRHVRH